jgi:hypothetical protein
VGTSESPQTVARVAATWGDVYNSPTLGSIPFYSVGGYQDWQGNITAERGMTTGPTGRWQYPSLWHSFIVNVPPSFNTLQVVMVDTVTLTGDMLDNPMPAPPAPPFAPGAILPSPPPSPPALAAWQMDASTDTGAAAPGEAPAGWEVAAAAPTTRHHLRKASLRRQSRRLLDFNTRNNPPVSIPQWRWLSHVVNTSTADWLIVIGNDPIWSAGAHGPTWGLTNALLPLLNEHGAALYIAGRDPIAQHFRPTAAFPAVDVVTIGIGSTSNATMASALPMLDQCPPGSLAFAYGNTTGFLGLTLTAPNATRLPSTLTVTFYNSAGEAVYSFSKQNNLRVRPDPYGFHTPTVPGLHVRANTSNGAFYLTLGLLGASMLGALYFVFLSLYGGNDEVVRRVRRVVASTRGASTAVELQGGKAPPLRAKAPPLAPGAPPVRAAAAAARRPAAGTRGAAPAAGATAAAGRARPVRGSAAGRPGRSGQLKASTSQGRELDAFSGGEEYEEVIVIPGDDERDILP